MLDLLFAKSEKLNVVFGMSENLTPGTPFSDFGASSGSGSRSMKIYPKFSFMGYSKGYVQVKHLILIVIAPHLHWLVLHQCLVLIPVQSKSPCARVLSWAENSCPLHVHGIFKIIGAWICGDVPVPHLPESIHPIDAKQGVIEGVGTTRGGPYSHDVQIVVVGGEDFMPCFLDTSKDAGKVVCHLLKNIPRG